MSWFKFGVQVPKFLLGHETKLGHITSYVTYFPVTVDVDNLCYNFHKC